MEPKSIKEIVDEIDISKYPEDLPIDYRSVSTRFVPNAMKGMTLDKAIEVMNVFEDHTKSEEFMKMLCARLWIKRYSTGLKK